MSDDLLAPDAHKAARTYGAAADHYMLPALGFWERFGSATVSQVPLSAGQAVLDLCCGAGASALPAAVAVGPSGRVVGVDVAAPLLRAARSRAAAAALRNVEFRRADARSTGLPGESFDAVICVFGVFFASDMPSFVAEMWRHVRPGGALAITTWGPGLFEPANGLFWDAVHELDPSLFKAFNPWDEITTPTALTDLFKRSGIQTANAEAVAAQHPLNQPDDFWDIVLGSGYRATVDRLLPDQRATLRERVLTRLAEHATATLRTDVVYGIATRP